MAIPFQIFDYERRLLVSSKLVGAKPVAVWCIRCQDYIPNDEVWGLTIDPHQADHLNAYYMLQDIDLRKERNGH